MRGILWTTGLSVLLLFSVQGASIDYHLNQTPERFNLNNGKILSDAADCENLQLQRNPQQLALLNASQSTVDVIVTFNTNVNTAECQDIIAAFNMDRLSAQPTNSSTYLFGRSYQCGDGAASGTQCTYTCECSGTPCQVITLIGAGDKANTESGTWHICQVEVTE